VIVRPKVLVPVFAAAQIAERALACPKPLLEQLELTERDRPVGRKVFVIVGEGDEIVVFMLRSLVDGANRPLARAVEHTAEALAAWNSDSSGALVGLRA
jgi:hypothetical protein